MQRLLFFALQENLVDYPRMRKLNRSLHLKTNRDCQLLYEGWNPAAIIIKASIHTEFVLFESISVNVTVSLSCPLSVKNA